MISKNIQQDVNAQFLKDFEFYDFVMKLQHRNQHLIDHQGQPCFEDSAIPKMCYPNPSEFICPRCWIKEFKGYSITDEHDTYMGMKCQRCNLDYSISH